MKEENKNTQGIEDNDDLLDSFDDDLPSDSEIAAMELQSALILKELAQEEQHKKIAEEAGLIDSVVFKLNQSLDHEDPENPDFSKILTRNARILNNAFEYYLENADKSKLPDRKIGLGIRMQSQLIRTIDVWRRLENSQNQKTK